jgi:pimeloyl-ACP methyl ester carboxylesterase
VVCHGQGASKDWGFFPPIVERLARAGFTAVSFTFSGGDQPRDLAIVLDALARGEWGVVPSAYGLLGHSRGGATCAQLAARDERPRALVTWGAPAGPEAGQVKAPWLIVHGDKDEVVPLQAARELSQVAPRAELLVVKGGSHTLSVGEPWRGPTRGFEIALGASVDWLSRHLS